MRDLVVLTVVLSTAVLVRTVPAGSSGAETFGSPAPIDWKRSSFEDYTYEDHLKQYARRKYGPLIALLKPRLSQDDLSLLVSILEAREVEVNQKKHTVESPDELLEIKRSFDQRIRKELGDDIAVALVDYLETAPARLMLAQVNLNLLYLGDPLTSDQIQRLSSAISKRAVSIEGGVRSREDSRAYIQKRIDENESILLEARGYLSRVQLEAVSHEMEFQVGSAKIAMLRAMSKTYK